MFQSAQVCADVCRCAWVFKGMCGCVQVYASMHKCVPVCAGVRRCVRVCTNGVRVVLRCMWVYAGVRGCTLVCVGVRSACVYVWDEFSEYLLETWVLTSADVNTYPKQIFYYQFDYDQILNLLNFYCNKLQINRFFWDSFYLHWDSGILKYCNFCNKFRWKCNKWTAIKYFEFSRSVI